jgi:hypothetical protein
MANEWRRIAAYQELGRRHPYATLYGGRLVLAGAVAVLALVLIGLADDAAMVVQSWSMPDVPRPPAWTALALVVPPVWLWRRHRTRYGYRRPLRRRFRRI